MALFIRDTEVDVLVQRVQELTRGPSKTAAVKLALLHEIQRQRESLPLGERLGKVEYMAQAMGFGCGRRVDFDMKNSTPRFSARTSNVH